MVCNMDNKIHIIFMHFEMISAILSTNGNAVEEFVLKNLLLLVYFNVCNWNK
jgi:hypothetical protein